MRQYNARRDVSDGDIATAVAGLFAVRADRTTAVSIPNNTWTTITLPTLVWDTQGNQYDATNDWIVIAEDGIYEVEARAQFDFSAVGGRGLRFRINNGDTNIIRMIDATAASSTGITTLCFFQTGLVAGDILDLQVIQDSGGALNLTFAHLAIAMIK